MTTRRVTAIAPAGLAASGAVVVPAATPALTAPPADGCPAWYQLRSVQTLTGEGSQVPAQADSPASGVAGERQGGMGQSGNRNGFVCCGQLIPSGLPVCDFTGNQFAL